MVIKRIESDLLLSNMYILEENGHALVIDPCRNVSYGNEIKTDAILLTHEHYDHISGVNMWKNKYHIPVICSKKCAQNITNPKANMSRYFNAIYSMQNWVKSDVLPNVDRNYTCEAEFCFQNELIFIWQEHILHLFELPGHSQGSCGILIDENMFFSGDSLIKNETVELRFPGGSKEDWERVSIPKIEALPDGIQVYPGHFGDFFWHVKET